MSEFLLGYWRAVWVDPVMHLCALLMGASLFLFFCVGWRTRLYARIYAYLTGHFWLPCPACGRMWGGHERWTQSLYFGPKSKEAIVAPMHGDGVMIPVYGKGIGVCGDPICENYAREQNTIVNEAWHKFQNPPPPRPQFEGLPMRRVMVKK